MHPLNERQLQFQRRVTNNFLFALFLLKQIPAACFAGLRINKLSSEQCVVSLPYKWLTQNPFRSIYFASQAMAAEMSTGVLGMMAIQRKEKISMLVTQLESEFIKKASSKIYFTCDNGTEIFDAIEKTISTGDGVTVRCLSTGRTADGTIVSNFFITWSFKKKNS